LATRATIPGREADCACLVRAGQVEGILLFSGRMPQADFALSHTVPITLVCNDIAEMKDLPVFEIANRNAGADHGRAPDRPRASTDRPHHGPATNIEAIERVSGYTGALTAAGVRTRKALGTAWECGCDA
jgi:LacI family repressor for deo operon, udp, cdd, tsx, nupC, and nupG